MHFIEMCSGDPNTILEGTSFRLAAIHTKMTQQRKGLWFGGATLYFQTVQTTNTFYYIAK